LLSREGVNLAIRGSDPSYPAMCTQTMIGDNIYDVIIIEYDRRFDSGLNNLVRRLRHRFPEATIIATQMWTFGMFRVTIEGKKMMFLQWLKENGFERNNAEVKKLIYNLKIDDMDITFLWQYGENREDYMNTLEKMYNITIYRWETGGDIKSLLLKHLPFYIDDWVHLSDYGHQFIADGIKEIVEAKAPKRSDHVSSWGDGDFCSQWIYGDIDGKVETYFRYRSNVKLEKFNSKRNYYALHFPLGGHLMKITNPFNGTRQLSLTYMATGPVQKIYPDTLVQIINSGSSPMVIVPFDTYYSYPVHIQLTKKIGPLKPGENDVIIKTLEKSECFFRLIGFTITNGENKASDMFDKNILE